MVDLGKTTSPKHHCISSHEAHRRFTQSIVVHTICCCLAHIYDSSLRWIIECVQVHGGVDLRLGKTSSPKHRRISSHEALLRMAQQQGKGTGSIPSPPIISPIPEDFMKPSLQQQQQEQQQAMVRQAIAQHRVHQPPQQQQVSTVRGSSHIVGTLVHYGMQAKPPVPAAVAALS